MRNLTKKKKKLDIWFWLKFCMMTELTVCLDWQCIYYYHHHHYYVCVWIIIKSKKKIFFFSFENELCARYFFFFCSLHFDRCCCFGPIYLFTFFFIAFFFFRMDAAFAQHAVQMQLAVLWTHTHTLHIGFYICNRRSQDNDDSNLWMNKATYTKIWKPFLFCLVLFCLAYPSRYYSGEKSLFFLDCWLYSLLVVYDDVYMTNRFVFHFLTWLLEFFFVFFSYRKFSLRKLVIDWYDVVVVVCIIVQMDGLIWPIPVKKMFILNVDE